MMVDDRFTFVLDLPSGLKEEVDARAAEFWNQLPKRAVTRALSPDDAVRNYLFRTFRNKNVAKKLYRALVGDRSRESTKESEKYAIEFPVDARDEFEMDCRVAGELASVRGGEERVYFGLAREIVDFYNHHRAERIFGER